MIQLLELSRFRPEKWYPIFLETLGGPGVSASRLKMIYLGGLLVACLVLGGGTQKGLPTLFILQMLALPMVWMLALGRNGPLPRDALFLLWAVLGIFVFQLVPSGLGRPAELDLAGLALTMDMGRTLDSLAFFIVPAAFFAVCLGLTENERNRLLPYFLLGVVLNLSLALVQFAAYRGIELELFPYALGAGFFANQNHFSALVYVAIPFIVYQLDAIERLWLSLPILAVLILVQFAAGSVAGILLCIMVTMISYAVLTGLRPGLRYAFLALTGVVAAVAALNIEALDPGATSPGGRLTFIQTTLRAIAGHMPWGTGLGTFPIVYPEFETTGQILGSFANHAHNDFLELLLEGGLPVAAALLAYAVMLASRLGRNAGPFRYAAFCAMGFLLVHSLADYPLRTMAMAMVFAYFNAIWLARRETVPVAGKTLA